MRTEYELVYTMTDYYNGPRGGIANFNGTPHLYESMYTDFTEDTGYDVFLLQATDAETLTLAEEDWEIWLRWEAAFYAKIADLSTHPALPKDRRRYEELQTLLAARLTINPQAALRATAEFIWDRDRQWNEGRLMARWTLRSA